MDLAARGWSPAGGGMWGCSRGSSGELWTRLRVRSPAGRWRISERWFSQTRAGFAWVYTAQNILGGGCGRGKGRAAGCSAGVGWRVGEQGREGEEGGDEELRDENTDSRYFLNLFLVFLHTNKLFQSLAMSDNCGEKYKVLSKIIDYKCGCLWSYSFPSCTVASELILCRTLSVKN